MLKPLLLLPAVVFLALGAASNPSPMPQEGTGASKAAKNANDPANRAKKIYDVDCAICHGANGDGKTDLAKDMQLNLSDFTDPKTLSSKTDDQLYDLIRKGKDKMPAEEPARAKNDEIKALVLYLRTLSKNGPAAPAPAAAPAPDAAAPSSPGSH